MRINRKFSFFACCPSLFYPSPYRLPSVAAKASRDNDDKRRWNEKLLCHCMLKGARREQGKISAWKSTWFHVGCCVPVSPVSPNRHQFALVLRFLGAVVKCTCWLEWEWDDEDDDDDGGRLSEDERRERGKRGKIPRSMKSMWRFSHFRCRCRLDSAVASHRACATGSDWKWWWESRNRVLHARMPLYASESSEFWDFFIHSSGSWIKLCFSQRYHVKKIESKNIKVVTIIV